MKKNFRALTSLALSLALAVSLALPALAVQDTDPPLWQSFGFSSYEEMLSSGWTEEEYAEMVAAELEYQQYYAKREAREQAWIEANPDLIAAFDPYAYFSDEFYYYDSPEEYISRYDMTEEEFRQEMLDYWIWDVLYELELQEERALEKVAAGGFADGINVMFNGKCIPFPDVRPEIHSGRTMVPLAAAMEFLGAQVAYSEGAHTATVSMQTVSFTHAIGTGLLVLSDGSQISMDVPSYVKDGRTMVPVAFFAQCLGYEVYWDSDYQAAVVLDRQAAVDAIDQNFSLFNRILYTSFGSAQYQAGLSQKSALGAKLSVTMLDSLRGDKAYSMTLKGNSLVSETAGSLEYSGNLGQLIDLIAALDTYSYYRTEEQEQAYQAELDHYRKLLTAFSLEMILDLEGQCAYLRSPLLAELEMTTAPDAWAAIPLGLFLDESAYTIETLTVGQLIVASGFASPYGYPFLAWENATSAAEQLASLVGDDRFSRSGSSYTVKWDDDDLPFYLGDSDFSAALTVTPAGALGCTYSLTMALTYDDAAFDLKLTGSSSKSDLEVNLHVKNMLKATLTGELRLSSTSQQPPSQPPEGAVIEYPVGMLGSAKLEGDTPVQ